jgi:hypothetical protein
MNGNDWDIKGSCGNREVDVCSTKLSSDIEMLVTDDIVVNADFGVTNAVVVLSEARMMAEESFIVVYTCIDGESLNVE